MAITIYTRAEIEAQVMAYFRNRFPGRDMGTESFLGKTARAVTMALVGLQKAVADADNDASPSSKTSITKLDQFADLFGLPSNSGGYGRDGATTSSGGAASITGTNGTAVSDGATLTASDGVTVIALDGAVTIPGSPPWTGSATGAFIAVTAGTGGNLPVDEVLTWQSPPAGLDATVTLTTALAGAVDIESDADLLERIFDRLQTPPKGGAAIDYKTWSESALDANGVSVGIDTAYVYPNRGGLGTVHVVLTVAGTGTARQPGSTTDDDTYVADRRPVAVEGYESFIPSMLAARALTARVRMVPSLTKYNFDWVDTGASYSISAASATGITLNTAAPTTLIDAITSGALPRLQILSTGSGYVANNPQVRISAIDATNTILTIDADTKPDTWVVPAASDVVYAGGPMVDTIAQAIVDYVDSLGPSRAGGFADPNELWEDTVAISRLTQIALDQTDTDGTRFATNTISGGVTIAIGAGASATADVQAQDNTGGAPELLYLKHVAVTQ